MHASSNIEIIRSTRRKTVGIHIKDGNIQLTIPHRLSEREIQRILTEKNSWIQRKLREDAQIIRPQPKQFMQGELFSCLGELYPLNFVDTKNKKIHFNGFELQIPAPNIVCPNKRHQHLYKKISQWYMEYAERVLREKTHYYAEIMQLRYQSVAIKKYKSRWGSCNSKREIQYNWQLILAPEWIVDYVVVHEIAHLKHLNHSRQFWQLVASIIPNHLQCRKWLREHGATLRLD